MTIRPKAGQDIEEIYTYLFDRNPKAARQFVRGLMAKVHLAAGQPGIGPPRPDIGPGVRILIHGRFVAINEPTPDGIDLVAVVHTARDPGSWLD